MNERLRCCALVELTGVDMAQPCRDVLTASEVIVAVGGVQTPEHIGRAVTDRRRGDAAAGQPTPFFR